jgi:hypothetical protein
MCPAVMAEQRRASARVERKELNLISALRNSISEEENIKVYALTYADEC